MNYGLILPEKIETREEGAEHVLGGAGLPEPIINPSGDYLPYIPEGEPQSAANIETSACTLFGTNNALETQIKLKTGITINYSDRYVANVARRKGVLKTNGANPHDIAEMLRKESGETLESHAPWTNDIKSADDYYSLDTAPLIPEALRWYGVWKLTHKWVFSGGTPQSKRIALQDALKRGTVCVSILAFYFDNAKGWYTKPEGGQDGDWVQLVSAESDKPYKILTSYAPFLKDLDPLYDFAVAKVFFLTPAPFLKNLYFQMTDPEVARLQSALVSLKYQIPHAVTNVYGTETRSAVMSFQRDHQIIDDGSHFGPRTRLALNTKLNPTAPFGGDFLTYLAAFFSGV